MDHFSLPDDGLNILLLTMSYTISSLEFTHTFPRRPKNNKETSAGSAFGAYPVKSANIVVHQYSSGRIDNNK
jgi:hypothetical protein